MSLSVRFSMFDWVWAALDWIAIGESWERMWTEVAIMGWSTFWPALGSIAAAVSAVAIGIAAYQLWFHAWLKAQEIFTSRCFVRARGAVFAHFDDPGQPLPDPRSDYAKEVCRRMDELAYLAPFLGLPFLPFFGRKNVLRVWGNPIAKAWLLLEPTVKEEREISHWAEKWRAFQKLGEAAVRRNPKLKQLREKVLTNTALGGTESE